MQREVFIGSKDEFTRLRAPPPADAFFGLADAGCCGFDILSGSGSVQRRFLESYVAS